MAFGWEGELIRLVPLDIERHFETVVRWVNDLDVTSNLLIGDRPITRHMEKAYFEQAMAESQTEVRFAIETLDGRHIGMSGVHRIDLQSGTATTGSFIGEKEDRGKGYGTDAARTRNRYCFEDLGLRMVLSEHFGGNEASARMLAKAGFIEWGRLPEAMWKRGRYVDEIKVYLTRERWLSMND